MSYPVSGRFPINNLNFLDKHSYGSGIEKINKFSDNKFNYKEIQILLNLIIQHLNLKIHPIII
jgi:hypothetical protein